MKEYIVDIHLHSKYSRATSKFSDLENLNIWGKIKGIDILGTGDFTHPKWSEELENKLEPNGNGLFLLKDDIDNEYIPELLKGTGWLEKKDPILFMLTTEISCIYSKAGKVRRLHICLTAPSFETVKKINKALSKIGNLLSDGRPILGLDAKELLKIVLDIDDRCLVIPAHIWTPWFSLFGSKSGFDSLQDCFEEYSNYIYAVETGLSSDPQMNWMLSQLNDLLLVSNSDAHSPPNIGREANVVRLESPSYYEFVEVIKNKNKDKFLKTIEFFPEEGKYHLDGHAKCNLVFHPQQTKEHAGICPVCHKNLTIGVLHRVYELADLKKEEINVADHIPFVSIVPLLDIISEVYGKNKNTKFVNKIYFDLIRQTENEFYLLLKENLENLKIDYLLKEAIQRVRQRKIILKGGYDGVYGKVKILTDRELQKQKKLF